MVRKTDKIKNLIAKDLSGSIEKEVDGRDKELIRRTAAFLLLKDSKASFCSLLQMLMIVVFTIGRT
jgi:hypothetical protein